MSLADDDRTQAPTQRAEADGRATDGTGAPDGPRSGPPGRASDPGHGRPTVWIVISAVLAFAVVGLGIWAFSAQSDADDTQARLDTATAAAAANQGEQSEAQATPAPTADPAPTAEPAPPAQPAELDPAAQQQLDQLTDAIGATNENLEDIQSDLDAAAANAEEAEQAKAEASTAIERAQADVQAFKADAELAGACLRGVLEAVRTAFSTGGTQAAVQQAQALVGSCRSAGG